MDLSDTLEQNKQQIVDKASEFAENAQPYIDQAKPYVEKITGYAKANPIEAMVATGLMAFILGSLFSARR